MQNTSNEKSKTKVVVEISPLSNTYGKPSKSYYETFETNDIDYTMEQFQRNREPFNWKIQKHG